MGVGVDKLVFDGPLGDLTAAPERFSVAPSSDVRESQCAAVVDPSGDFLDGLGELVGEYFDG